MRWNVVWYYLGLFLRIFSVLLLVPVAVGKYYGESFVVMEPFLIAAFLAIVTGAVLTWIGTEERPGMIEAMAIATLSWILAGVIGAIPVYEIAGIPMVDAYFDATAGFTTTGMVIIPHHNLPHSLLFWRIFTQWIGGLGILTFFVMVLAESGGVASKLVSTEANKTDSGVIRPSLFNAIKSMWYVYIVLTVIEAVLLYYFSVPGFHAVTHAMGTLPTGGFSTTGDFGAMMGGGARVVLTIFMFLGGVNFLLLYSLFQGNIWKMYRDYEFRLYFSILAAIIFLIGVDLVTNQGMTISHAFATAAFHTSSMLSSSGYMLVPAEDFPVFSQTLIIFMMIVGASLGSTTGGVKMLRLGVMIRAVRNYITSMTLPPTVMNPITVKGRILEDREILEIASFFFLWIGMIFIGGISIVWMTGHGIAEATQVMASSLGTMGPTFLSAEQLRALPPLVKLLLSFGMLAGRLELLPLVALINMSIANKLRR